MSLLLRESQYFLHNHCFILHTKSLNAFRALVIFCSILPRNNEQKKEKEKNMFQKTKQKQSN